MDKEEYENIWFNRIAYRRTYSSSEDSLESIVCHASQEESTTQEQSWSEEIEALSNLPGGDIALSLIPTLHGDALQKVLEEFQCVTFNKNEDRNRRISLRTSADEIEQKTILFDENRAATTTPVQLLAEWPDTCLLISSWLNHVEIVKALLEKDVPVSTSDNDKRTDESDANRADDYTDDYTDNTDIVVNREGDRSLKFFTSIGDPLNTVSRGEAYEQISSSSENNLESIICLTRNRSDDLDLRDESTTQKQSWSKSRTDVDARRSALYYAVLNNAVDCVEALLQAGVSPNSQVHTTTPLHVAATLGNVHCIKLLLKHKADVTIEMGTTKLTPLLLTAEKGNAECTKLLLDAGASTETRNSSGQTAMHLATLAQSVETINMLISAGAKVNAEDDEGRTPLHAAVAKTLKSSEIIKILIQDCASINKADNSGYTPLHIAALNENSHSVMILLSKGGDMTARTKGGVAALNFIVRRTPNVFSRFVARLNQAISLHGGQLGDTDCELRVDFRSLVPLGGRNETDLMLCLVKVGQGHILKHPLCESFLHLKWKRIRIFFVLSLLFHLIFVVFFTGFVCATYVWNEKAEKLKSRVLFWSVITTICLFVSKEIFQITYGICYYIKRWENWLKWSVIVASSIILIVPQSHPSWQHHVAAVGILLAWIKLMIVIGYFSMFGLYVQMFKRVSINFFKFLAVYFCLLIGFSLSFNVLHSKYKSFTDPLISLLKTVIMMSGELEFVDVFFNISDKAKVVPLEYPGTAHVMFFCFVILVTVILMNLIIGLAVSDIQKLCRRAGFERLAHHTKVIAHFENMLFSKLFDYTPASKIIEKYRKNTQLLHSLHHDALHIRPNDPNEKSLSRDLIRAVNRLISEKKARRMTLRGTKRHQNVLPNKSKTQQGVQQREQSTAAKRIRGRVEETLI